MNDATWPTHEDENERGRRWSLAELTEETGVSVRTVRFYISEGLLPPPLNPGPRASYSQAHYDRLVLIDRMKADYLPLKEIRRRLDELSEDDIHRLASERTPAPLKAAAIEESGPQTASAYIAHLLHRPKRAVSAPLPASVPDAMEVDESFLARSLPSPEPAAWRKVPLSDGAELLIRDDLYQRKREKVDWLVSWARKVFG
jgi:DNA-binding transcriptional MerR regulator